jgi:hypothetical protein
MKFSQFASERRENPYEEMFARIAQYVYIASAGSRAMACMEASCT